MNKGRYKEIYRIYKGQVGMKEGITLARRQNNEEELAFILFKTSAELNKANRMLMEGTIRMLGVKCGTCSTATEARASLILGMATDNHRMMRTAHDYYKSNHNYLEA